MANYSTTRMVKFLGISRKSVLARAVREGWIATTRYDLGGGKEWQDYSFPKATLRQVNACLAIQQGAKFASKQSSNSVNKAARQEPLNGMRPRAKDVALAKAHILTAVEHAVKTSPHLALSVVENEFATLYRKREADMPEWVYKTIPKLCRSSLRNWAETKEKRGIRALARQQDRRRPRNFIDNDPRLKDFVLGMLYEFPHTSAREIWRGLDGRFGPEGKEYDPSIKLPCKRRLQDWVKGWKEANAQLLLAHVNPDKSRSKDKFAFGDAAAHIYYLNQEWQSDGTLCELMLNDGRRHTLNLTVRVYSRELSFHVSRTSSAAAVGSGMRKAMVKWGIPGTWKTDNGSDYKNQHMERFSSKMQFVHELCPPFSPDKKPFVERAFKTFLYSHIEILPGYLGHSVADRKDIEARKSYADRIYRDLRTPGKVVELNISPEELQRIGDEWAEYVYGNEPHTGLDGMTPNQKAAAYDGTVKRIEDERDLDMLLLPVPGDGGMRTVGKKGIAVTTEICGVKFPGNYIGTDLHALKRRKVLVCFDEACLGRVILFDPATYDYLGKAEHPGLMGWTQEDVQRVAKAAESKRKALVAEEKKVWRNAAKRADVLNIGNEIIATHKARAAASPLTPAYETEPYTTHALEQAARARTGDFVAPTPEECAQARAELDRMLKPKAPVGFVAPENITERLEFWRSLYDRKVAGEALEEDEQRWFRSFAHDEYCKQYCILHRLDISLAA